MISEIALFSERGFASPNSGGYQSADALSDIFSSGLGQTKFC
jgi:hypothetical protein